MVFILFCCELVGNPLFYLVSLELGLPECTSMPACDGNEPTSFSPAPLFPQDKAQGRKQKGRITGVTRTRFTGESFGYDTPELVTEKQQLPSYFYSKWVKKWPEFSSMQHRQRLYELQLLDMGPGR